MALRPAFYLPDAALEHCAREPNVNRIGWMEGRAREGAGEPKNRIGEARKTRGPCTWEAETREPPPYPSPLLLIPAPGAFCPRARFSVLAPDGVQGVLAVPAKKVQASETSGCRHYQKW